MVIVFYWIDAGISFEKINTGFSPTNYAKDKNSF